MLTPDQAGAPCTCPEATFGVPGTQVRRAGALL